jgi:uncharacterized protein YndB with AHSA1/START domain
VANGDAVIRGAIRLSVVGVGVGLAADYVLRRQAGGKPPAPIRSLVVIDAPIERVWAVVADIEGQPRWMLDMKSVRLLSSGPIGLGTRGESTVRILGLTTIDPVTVTEFEPPTRFAIRHEGSWTGDGIFTLEPGADGTTTIVRWEETLVGPVFPYLGAIVQAPILGAIFQADLERLRELVEADDAGAG